MEPRRVHKRKTHGPNLVIASTASAISSTSADLRCLQTRFGTVGQDAGLFVPGASTDRFWQDNLDTNVARRAAEFSYQLGLPLDAQPDWQLNDGINVVQCVAQEKPKSVGSFPPCDRRKLLTKFEWSSIIGPCTIFFRSRTSLLQSRCGARDGAQRTCISGAAGCCVIHAATAAIIVVRGRRNGAAWIKPALAKSCIAHSASSQHTQGSPRTFWRSVIDSAPVCEQELKYRMT